MAQAITLNGKPVFLYRFDMGHYPDERYEELWAHELELGPSQVYKRLLAALKDVAPLHRKFVRERLSFAKERFGTTPSKVKREWSVGAGARMATPRGTFEDFDEWMRRFYHVPNQRALTLLAAGFVLVEVPDERRLSANDPFDGRLHTLRRDLRELLRDAEIDRPRATEATP